MIPPEATEVYLRWKQFKPLSGNGCLKQDETLHLPGLLAAIEEDLEPALKACIDGKCDLAKRWSKLTTEMAAYVDYWKKSLSDLDRGELNRGLTRLLCRTWLRLRLDDEKAQLFETIFKEELNQTEWTRSFELVLNVPRYRSLFPTVHDQKGYLVDVSIYRVNDGGLIVAPWSVFETKSSDLEDIWNKIVDAIPALKGAGFVVEFNPITPTELTPKLQSPEAAAFSLTSERLIFEGRSLGLTLAAAGWAAAGQVSMPKVIATGAIDSSGKVGRVGGVPEKLKACARARDYGLECTILISDGNESEATRSRDRLPIVYLKEACEIRQGWLTDGLDDWRKIADEGQAPGSRQLRFLDAGPSASQPGVEAAFVEWDADPEAAARAIVEDHNSTSGALQVDQESYNKTVAIPVPLELLGDELGDLSPVAKRLAELVRRWSHTDQPSAEAVMNCLRRDNKLQLVVYASRSTEFWADGEDQRAQQWAKVIALLAEKSRVILVCADYHAARLWGKLLSGVRLASVVECMTS